jgi:pimeloyl-ACP methyl ester carboxylesterase
MALEYKHPDDYEHRYAQINGIRMHYVQSGNGNQLVVLLHGFPESWYSWRHQIPVLAQEYTVVAPDMRGYNETEKPRRGYELNVLVADIVALIRHLGRERAFVVGHDWGGAIAWALAISQPALVERLIVLNAPHLGCFGLGSGMGVRQMLRSWYMLAFQIPILPELLLRIGDFSFIEHAVRGQAYDRTHFTDQDMHFMRQAIARPGALTAAINYYRRGLLHTGGIFKGTGLRVHAPTLLIWAEGDRLLGKELTYQTAQFVPDLRIQYIERCSHWVQQERPELVNRWLLTFLEEENHG